MNVRVIPGFYSDYQEGMYDCLAGMFRRINSGIDLDVAYSEDMPRCVRLGVHYRGLRRVLVAVAEDNVKMRRGPNGNATWRDDQYWRPEEYRSLFVNSVNAYAVFYDPAFKRGSVWSESSGNVYIDDYRRLIWHGVLLQGTAETTQRSEPGPVPTRL